MKYPRPALGPLPLHTIELFKGFLKKPKEVASIAPSSPFLIRRVLAASAVHEARVIVELGPGTGVVTEQILRRMNGDSTLIAVEINPDFADLVRRKLPDPRLTLHWGPSTEIEEALAAAGCTQADLVVSGIPFSTMGREEGRRTLEAVRRALAPDGRFVAYQVRAHVQRFAEPIFGAAEVHAELWNIPPMRVFVWNGAAAREMTALAEAQKT